MQHLIQAVRAHANRNYNTGGWDYLVECWSDEDIADCIEGCDTAAEAIQRCEEHVGTLDEYRREIQSTVW